LFDRAARHARTWFDPIVETDSIDLLKRLAALSGVVTVLTRADVELERQQGVLAFVPLHSSEAAFQTLSIVGRASAQFNTATARFVEKLVEFVDRVGIPDKIQRVPRQK
jgi:DNA-binding transcriptional LysR family regulator